MDYIDDILSSLESYSSLGTRTLANGARLIGHIPAVAPEAYLHSVFPGLDQTGMARLEGVAGRPLPESLRALYSRCNGLILFNGALSLFGLRDPFLEGDEGDVGQPFSIDIPNLDERPGDAKDDMVFFGVYEWDGSLLYGRPGSAEVIRCRPDSVRPVTSWPSLAMALTGEVKRLRALHGRDGLPLYEDVPTAPDPVL